jgi:hypothetical protein
VDPKSDVIYPPPASVNAFLVAFFCGVLAIVGLVMHGIASVIDSRPVLTPEEQRANEEQEWRNYRAWEAARDLRQQTGDRRWDSVISQTDRTWRHTPPLHVGRIDPSRTRTASLRMWAWVLLVGGTVGCGGFLVLTRRRLAAERIALAGGNVESAPEPNAPDENASPMTIFLCVAGLGGVALAMYLFDHFSIGR